MQVTAKSRYVRVSPYKLRPYVDVIRGATVEKALAFLKTCAVRRAEPIQKVVFSAYSNAKNREQNISMKDLVVKEIKVDQGPTYKYFKAGAMGRASIQKKRLSHIEVLVAKN